MNVRLVGGSMTIVDDSLLSGQWPQHTPGLRTIDTRNLDTQVLHAYMVAG